MRVVRARHLVSVPHPQDPQIVTEQAPPSFFSPTREPSVAQTTEDVRELADWIRNRDRQRPLVVLTARNKERDPFFHPDDVVPLVAGAGDIVAIRQLPKSALTVELSKVLPDGMSVFNGAARIYWPIDLAGSHPSRHPLVLADSDASSSAEKRARLANRWRQPPRGLQLTAAPLPPVPRRSAPSAPPRPRPVRPVAPPAAPQGAAPTTPGPPTPVPAAARALPVRPPAPTLDPPMPPQPPVPDPLAPTVAAPKAPRVVGPGEDELRTEITRAWLALLPDPADRNRFGLQAYRLHRELAAQLEIHEPIRSAVAAAAARIVSGYAWTQVSPIPERVEENGAPVVRDGDHAVGWRYPLPGDDRFLFYWQPAAGPAVLTRIGAQDRTELPEAATITPRHHPEATATETTAPAPISDARLAALENALERQRLELERLAARPAEGPVPVPAAPVAPPVPVAPPAPEVDAPARPATPPQRGGNARQRSLDIPDDVLIGALDTAGRPLTSRELRQVLGIDPEVPGHHVTRMLNRALASGVLQRTGNRQGTRYSPA